MDYQLKESLRMKIYMRLLLFPPDVFQVDMKTELLKVEQAERELFSQIFTRGGKETIRQQRACKVVDLYHGWTVLANATI